VLLRNFPFVGEVRLTVLTRFRERAIRSYRTIDRLWALGLYMDFYELTLTLDMSCLVVVKAFNSPCTSYLLA
jgi:hypothetical protein